MKVYLLPSYLPPAIPSREVIPSRFYALGEACTVFDDRDRAIVARFRRSKEIETILDFIAHPTYPQKRK